MLSHVDMVALANRGSASAAGGIRVRGRAPVQVNVGADNLVVLPIHLHLEIEDACGTLIESAYVLRRPDGGMEDGRLADGVLHRACVPAGDYEVLFPEIVDLAWSVDSIEQSPGAEMPAVELIIRHVAIAAAREAIFTFVREADAALVDADEDDDDDDEVVHEMRRPLATDDARLDEVQETRVAWRCQSLEPLAAGESCEVICRVEVDGLTLDSPPLRVCGPAIDDTDGPGESLHLELEDAFGEPLVGPVVIEHPDGRLEAGRVVGGVLCRDGVLAGSYAIHLGGLTEARWSVDSAEPGAEVALIVRHTAVGAAYQAVCTFVREADADEGEEADEEVLGTLGRRLDVDAGRLLDEQETRLTWRIDGIAALAAGDSCDVVCRVEVAGLVLESPPLRVRGPELVDNG